MKKQNIFTISTNNETNQNDAEGIIEEADFETAIAKTKFGKFNIILLLIAIPGGWSAVYDTSAMSYVFPAAQCDLHLTLVNKGTLNAIIYIGMISSAFMWGYLADTLGRKNILVFGYLIDSACNFCCSFSQTLWMLLLFKFLSGFVVSGPFAVLMAYLSEFHAKKIRSKIILVNGVFFSTANCVLPLIAWWIMPKKLDYITKYFELHSWNYFILITAIPPLLAGIGQSFLPESPKFLMTTGRNKEAMEIFKKIYSMNTGKPQDTFPVLKLIDETQRRTDSPDLKISKITANRSKKLALKEGLQQIKPLFFPPYLRQIIVLFFMYFGLLMSMNTLRLWLPQIFASMDQHQQLHPELKNVSLCEMIKTHSIKATTGDSVSCFVVKPKGQVYINSVIVAFCSLCGYIAAALVVDLMGKKILIISLLTVGGLAGLANYWSTTWEMTLGLSSTHVSLVGISCTTIVTLIVEIFPTSLRTMTLSLTMMCGRIGSITGNLLFPVLIHMGCLQPFLLIGGTCIICSWLIFALKSKIQDGFE